MPGTGFEPVRPFGQGGLRLHDRVRLVSPNPSGLLTSTALVRPVCLVRPDPPRIAESRAGIVQVALDRQVRVAPHFGRPLYVSDDGADVIGEEVAAVLERTRDVPGTVHSQSEKLRARCAPALTHCDRHNRSTATMSHTPARCAVNTDAGHTGDWAS